MLLPAWLNQLVAFYQKRLLTCSHRLHSTLQFCKHILNDCYSSSALPDNRTLLTTITAIPPDSTGTLEIEEILLEVTFSDTVNGTDIAASYMLVRARVDDLLGSADDVVMTIGSDKRERCTSLGALLLSVIISNL